MTQQTENLQFPLLGSALYDAVNTQVKELTRRYQNHMACKEGCHQCCLSGFKVTYVEALNVFQAFAQLPPKQAEVLMAQLSEVGRLNCPLLLEGSCSVYGARPVLCRAFGLAVQVDDTVGTCELNFQKFPTEESMTVLTLRPYYDALDDVSDALWSENPLPVEPVDGLGKKAPRLTLQDWLQRLIKASQNKTF